MWAILLIAIIIIVAVVVVRRRTHYVWTTKSGLAWGVPVKSGTSADGQLIYLLAGTEAECQAAVRAGGLKYTGYQYHTDKDLLAPSQCFAYAPQPKVVNLTSVSGVKTVPVEGLTGAAKTYDNKIGMRLARLGGTSAAKYFSSSTKGSYDEGMHAMPADKKFTTGNPLRGTFDNY